MHQLTPLQESNIVFRFQRPGRFLKLASLTEIINNLREICHNLWGSKGYTAGGHFLRKFPLYQRGRGDLKTQVMTIGKV